MGIPLKTDTKLFNCKEAAALEQDNEDEYDDDEYLPAEVNINPVQAAMMEDDRDEFVSLIKGVSKDRILEAYSEMFSFDSVYCFAAMLAGEAGEVLNTAYFLAVEDNIPLHGSARALRAPKITTLLLEKGYEANLRTDFTSMDVCLENALPLNVALETYRAYRWMGGSAVHLVTSFCGPMWPCKETIAILARNTKEIKLEFYEYLEQGKMVEVGILLTVASDCILSPSAAEGEEDISFKNLSEMHKFLSAEIAKLSVDANNTQSECENPLQEMKMTLELLEIFDKIGDKLIAQTQTKSELVSLIQDAGFDVEDADVYNTDSKFRRSIRVNIVEPRLHGECPRHLLPLQPTVPSTFEERELCYQAFKSGQWSKFPMSVSLLPSRITLTVDRRWFTEKQAIGTRASGIEVEFCLVEVHCYQHDWMMVSPTLRCHHESTSIISDYCVLQLEFFSLSKLCSILSINRQPSELTCQL